MCDPATVADVRARDFSGVLAAFTDDQIGLLLEDATCYIGSTPWNGCECCYEKAKIFLSMHLAVLGANGQASGPLIQASAGGIYAAWAGGNTSGGNGLGSTNWGRQVEALAAGCGRTGPVVIISAPTCC